MARITSSSNRSRNAAAAAGGGVGVGVGVGVVSFKCKIAMIVVCTLMVVILNILRSNEFSNDYTLSVHQNIDPTHDFAAALERLSEHDDDDLFEELVLGSDSDSADVVGEGNDDDDDDFDVDGEEVQDIISEVDEGIGELRQEEEDFEGEEQEEEPGDIKEEVDEVEDGELEQAGDENETENENLQQDEEEDDEDEQAEEGEGEDISFTETKDEIETQTVTTATTFESSSSSSSSKFAIFYNTFSTVNNTDHAHSIISSQLEEVNQQPILDGAPLFYTRIGELNWEWPVDTCQGQSKDNNEGDGDSDSESESKNKRTCTEIIATEEGDEILSLQPLYEYCVANPTHTAIYMHSKGTYTASKANDCLRTVLMKAILSDECLSISNSKSKSNPEHSCDTCSTRFMFTPFLSYTGNMFVTNCDYVSKLIPPKDFGGRKKEVVDIMLNEKTKKVDDRWYETKLDDETRSYVYTFKSLPFLKRESWLGMDRYGSEHWVASHPDLRPCEVFQEGRTPPIIYGKVLSTWGFQEAILGNIQESFTKEKAYDFWITKKNKEFVYNPYYGKDGRIWEYKQLYGKIPPSDSWFHTLWSEFVEFEQWHQFSTYDEPEEITQEEEEEEAQAGS